MSTEMTTGHGIVESNKSYRQFTSTYNIDKNDPLQKYNKFYIILVGLGVLGGFIFYNWIMAIFFGVCGFFIPWLLIRILVAAPKLIKLRLTDYQLPGTISETQLLDYLKNNFSNNDVQLDTNDKKITFVYKNQTVLKVSIKNDKFNVTHKMKLAQRLKNGGKTNSAKLYTNVAQITPFIVQAIQTAASNILSEQQPSC